MVRHGRGKTGHRRRLHQGVHRLFLGRAGTVEGTRRPLYGEIRRDLWLLQRGVRNAQNDLTITKEAIRACTLCLMGKYKSHKNHQNTIESIVTNQPLDIVAIDCASNLIETRSGNSNILVVYDVFSKYVKFYPTERCNTRVTINVLDEYVREVGRPRKILADNATYFNNERFREHWENKNVQVIYTSIRRPNANPSERFVEECLKYLRMLAHENQTEWDKYLPEIERCINEVPNTVTQVAPVVLMERRFPDRPWTTGMQEYAGILQDVRKKNSTQCRKIQSEAKEEDQETRAFQRRGLGSSQAIEGNRLGQAPLCQANATIQRSIHHTQNNRQQHLPTKERRYGTHHWQIPCRNVVSVSNR